MYSKIFLTLIAVCLFLLGAAPVQAQFKWTVGGANTEEASSIIKTPDGGYAVAGKTLTYGMPGPNMYVVKFSASGTLQWTKSIGGANTDGASSIIRTTDGGYAVAGSTSSFGAGDFDMYIVKLDANGNVQWSKTIGGSAADYASSIIQTSDGGYAVSGNTKSFNAGNEDIYLVKLSSGGSLQWSRRAGGTGDDLSGSLIQTSDGGYAVAGSTLSYGSGFYDMYIIKFSSTGVPLWSRAIGGTSGDFGGSLLQTSDGSYVLAGTTQSFGAGWADIYVVKISAAGSILWTRTIGSSNYDYGRGIVQATDGSFIIGGATASFGASGDDIYVVKLNSSGSVQWQRRVGGSGNDFGTSITLTADGYAVAGYTNSYGAGGTDIFVVKFDLSGNICGGYSSPNGASGNGGNIQSLLPLSLVPSPTVLSPAPIVVWGGTVSALCLTAVEPNSNEMPREFSLGQNYPNPFNPKTIIKLHIADYRSVTLKVYDLLGKETAELINKEMQPGTYEVEFDGANYPSGIYFYTLQAGDFTETKKMILVK